MAIKCSLLGHSFTETEREEERKEQGSEVVITVKDVETCERCGKSRVVSENKEVTSIATVSSAEQETDEQANQSAPQRERSNQTERPDDVTTPDGPSRSTGTSPTPDIDAVEDDAELIGEAESTDETESDTQPTPETEHITGTVTDTAGVDEYEATAEEDDAVILDDDEPEREPGEWPDAVDDDTQTQSKGDEDGVAVKWPDDGPGSDTEEWTPSENLTSRIDEPDVEPAGAATVTVPEGEFECSECGFTTSVESTSLRAGDFCPDCHRGTLEHHVEKGTRKE